MVAATQSKKAEKSAKTTRPVAAPAEEEKVKRTPHPLVGVEDETKYPFVAVPADFSIDDHERLSKEDFVDEAGYFDYKAWEHEVRAKRLRAKAIEYRTLGSKEDRAKAKKLRSMQAKMAELEKELAEAGVDVAKLLASAAAPAKA